MHCSFIINCSNDLEGPSASDAVKYDILNTFFDDSLSIFVTMEWLKKFLDTFLIYLFD